MAAKDTSPEISAMFLAGSVVSVGRGVLVETLLVAIGSPGAGVADAGRAVGVWADAGLVRQRNSPMAKQTAKTPSIPTPNKAQPQAGNPSAWASISAPHLLQNRA